MGEIGWGWPAISRKAHIFSGARALCGGWLFTGKLDPFVVTDKPGPDDCKGCWSKARAAEARARRPSPAPKEGGNDGRS